MSQNATNNEDPQFGFKILFDFLGNILVSYPFDNNRNVFWSALVLVLIIFKLFRWRIGEIIKPRLRFYGFKSALFIKNRRKTPLELILSLRLFGTESIYNNKTIKRHITIKSTFKHSFFMNSSLLLIVWGYLRNIDKKTFISKLWKRENSQHRILQQLFKDFLVGGGYNCNNESIEQGRSYSNIGIDISDCFFSRSQQYSGYGSVIYVKIETLSMDILFSVFFNCSCSEKGGVIWFFASNSCLKMICANKCSASSYHFANLCSSNKNQVEYLSMSNCSHSTSGSYSFNLESGKQSVDNTNISMNNAYQVSGIWVYNPSSFTSSHCTFSNNEVFKRICVRFYSTSGSVSMSFANIVHNNSPGDGVVYVHGTDTKNLMYCIFHNNSNYLFYISSGYLRVSHSFIDHSSSFSLTATVFTKSNNSFQFMQTYQIQFFSSFYCNTDMAERTVEKSMISLEETLIMTFGRTIEPAKARTYDPECEMKMQSSERIEMKSDLKLFPIIISLFDI